MLQVPIATDKCMLHVLMMLHVGVALQREWRRVQARRSAAAAVIQSCWRGHVVRKQNGRMRRVLERCLRAYAALKEDRWDDLWGLAATSIAMKVSVASLRTLCHYSVEDRNFVLSRLAGLELPAAVLMGMLAVCCCMLTMMQVPTAPCSSSHAVHAAHAAGAPPAGCCQGSCSHSAGGLAGL